MMYIHFCPTCQTLFMLNGHKQECPRCGNPIEEIKLSFDDYSEMLPTDRELLRRKLSNPEFLEKNTTHYRFAKHTKRFKLKTSV